MLRGPSLCDVVEKFDRSGIKRIWVGGAVSAHKVMQMHPDFAKYVGPAPDYYLKKSRKSLLMYNSYLAKDLYGLDVIFEPKDAIIPTPGLRFKMIEMAVSGRLSHSNATQVENAIEIGTGASAIIALLAANCFDLEVIATEMDRTYLEYAENNIKRNHLEEKIKLIDSKGLILNGVIPKGTQVDIIITNPPYYPSLPQKDSFWGGKDHELLGKGEHGEKFVLRALEESRNLLKPGGVFCFLVPQKLDRTLIEIEKYLEKKLFVYDILGLQAGNRIRYLFRIYNL